MACGDTYLFILTLEGLFLPVCVWYTCASPRNAVLVSAPLFWNEDSFLVYGRLIFTHGPVPAADRAFDPHVLILCSVDSAQCFFFLYDNLVFDLIGTSLRLIHIGL